ncbi:MAG: CDP-alcohol phosphatidyltransferase family protein [Solirubrobacterales bacterium]|nr:CDP-alcohol phosphatidyltransferase family protein [Solirubrobacterales bacterium]
MTVGETAPFGRGRIRRLFGLDRTGAEPGATRSGQPLRPLTLPNLVGLVRLLAIPVFLVVAFDSGDGQSWTAAAIFLLISAGDYVDGFLARVTGQYSRFGALLDPVVDRLTILSGVVVCWHFDLLPHVLLLLLALRELVTLALARWGLSHGVDIEVNWFGRMAVFPVMAALLFAMVVPGWFPDTLLAVGLIMAVVATVLYARVGRDQIRKMTGAAQP